VATLIGRLTGHKKGRRAKPAGIRGVGQAQVPGYSFPAPVKLIDSLAALMISGGIP
jgi:hypothetical protein